MSTVLTTSQLTFCDLKDSYSVHLDTECVGVACDKDGKVIADQIVTINYGGYMGSSRIALQLETITTPSGITYNDDASIDATTTQDGVVTLNIAQGSNLGDVDSANVKIIFKTEDEFIFEKYIAFVKYMVGADGQAGTDAISFEIYSTDGYEFSDEITEINLKTIAYRGSSPLGSDVKYQWFLYTPEKDDNVLWTSMSEISENITDMDSILTVSKKDFDTLPVTLKCVMIDSDNDEYEAYVNLTDKMAVYTSTVKFFNDSNVFSASDEYLIAYVELYKNSQLIEGLSTPDYYFSENNALKDNVFETDLIGDIVNDDNTTEHSNGRQCYFIYKINNGVYNVGLGEYDSEEKKWNLVNSTYAYSNNVVENDRSNVVLILRNDVTKYKNIIFDIYERIDNEHNGSKISSTSAMVFDINDPIVSPGDPTLGGDVKFGQLWLDTSKPPYVLKIYTQIGEQNEGEWKYFEQTKGNRIFTPEPSPSDVSAGDFWVLGPNEEYTINYEDDNGNTTQSITYQEGSMLKAASFSDDENGNPKVVWKDPDYITTTAILGVKESFTWDNTGIQIAKKKEIIDNNGKSITQTPFYVHIDSERMGFHSVNYNEDDTQDDVEVVHIGNKSATIQNATFEGEGGTTFNNNARFNNNVQFNNQVGFGSFAWIIEENDSLSLDIAGTESTNMESVQEV